MREFYLLQNGDKVSMPNGKRTSEGIPIIEYGECIENTKILWQNGDLEDWSGIWGTFYEMGGLVTEKASDKVSSKNRKSKFKK